MGQKAFYQGKPLRPSLYICGVDVMGGDLTAKIESIDPRHEFWGKTIAIAKCVTADGPKMLRIGAEIEDSLVELFGADVTKWPGNSITLYFVPEVRYKGKKVGGARIRTDGQAPPRPRTEPDPAKSGKLTSQIMGVIGAAGSLDELTKISEKIKTRRGDLTGTDIKLLQREYKTRQDQVAAVPVEPDAVTGPEDPITGEVETVNQDTGEVTTVAAPEQGGLPLDGPPPDDDGIPDFGGPE